MKDTYGNKASITVRNPAIITWSKMSPLYEKWHAQNDMAVAYIERDLLNYIVRFTVMQLDGRAYVEQGHIRVSNVRGQDNTTEVYLEIVRKSDYYYRRVSLGSVFNGSAYSSVDIYLFESVPESNKIVYNVGSNLRLATVSASGATTNATIDSSFLGSANSYLNGWIRINKNYVVAAAYTSSTSGHTAMCNLNTYAHSSKDKTFGTVAACVTNSGAYYSFTISGYLISVTKVNLTSWAETTYTINIRDYYSTFPIVSNVGVIAHYDWTYDRIILLATAGTTLWVALMSGDSVSTNTYKTNSETLTSANNIHDVTLHSVCWARTVLTYTASSISFKSIPKGYGSVTGTIPGYGYLTGENTIVPKDLGSFTWIDKRIVNDIEIDSILPITNPLTLIGSFTVNGGIARAYATFKMSNTVFIRD